MDDVSKPQDERPAIAERYYLSRWRQYRRVRLAGQLELSIYSMIALGLLIHEWRLQLRVYGTVDPIGLFTAPSVIAGVVLIFFAIFSYLLTTETPLVAIFLRLSSARFAMAGVELEWRNEDRRSRSMSEEYERSDEGPPPQPPTQPPTQPLAQPSDPMEDNFGRYIQRSFEAARVAQRRPNALLFVGTIIAAAGLVFFVLTLPGSRYGFLDVPTSAGADLKADFWANAVQLVPRLLMLIFIQVLAGFFLRQYRSASEDFRYYESVLRHREAQYLSYTLRKRLDDKKAQLKFADEILKPHEFGVLAKGNSTASLEAQRGESNEFAALYERLLALVMKAEKKTRGPDERSGK